MDELAVGTVHELAGLPADGPRPLVLTPALARELPTGVGPAVLTVGSRAPRRRAGRGRAAAAGHRQAGQPRCAATGSRRTTWPRSLAAVDARRASRPRVRGPPAAGRARATTTSRPIRRWLPALPAEQRRLRQPPRRRRPTPRCGPPAATERRWRIRLGTALWHGDKSFAPPDGRRRRRAPGPRRRPGGLPGRRRPGRRPPGDGHRGHGARRAPARRTGLSPFHFARRRLALVEPPHMHTSMLLRRRRRALPRGRRRGRRAAPADADPGGPHRRDLSRRSVGSVLRCSSSSATSCSTWRTCRPRRGSTWSSPSSPTSTR